MPAREETGRAWRLAEYCVQVVTRGAHGPAGGAKSAVRRGAFRAGRAQVGALSLLLAERGGEGAAVACEGGSCACEVEERWLTRRARRREGARGVCQCEGCGCVGAAWGMQGVVRGGLAAAVVWERAVSHEDTKARRGWGALLRGVSAFLGGR